MLLVEDRPGDRYLIMEALELNGLLPALFEWASSLRDAKQYLSKHHYDVILLDLNLGDSFGLDTLSEIANESEGSAIVVVSGTLLESLESCKALGARAFINKDNLSGEALSATLQSIAPANDTRVDSVLPLNKRDSLAASLNRIGLLERLQSDLANGSGEGHLLALQFSDIRWPGRIGEMRQAVMTRLISKHIEALLMQSDESAVLAHMGGAEFCVWLPFSDRFAAEKLAEFLAERAREQFIARDVRELQSLQTGIAGARDCTDASLLIAHAKQALRHAQRFRLAYSIHTQPGTDDSERRDQQQADLEHSITSADCRFNINPVVDLENKKPVAAAIEAHWHLPGHPPLADAKLHQLTHNPATIERAFEILCKRACEQLKQWSGQQNRDWALQMSLSKHVLRLQSWPEKLTHHLNANNINPRQIWLSINESDLITAGADIKDKLATLSAAGYVIVIDDYQGLLPSQAEISANSVDMLIYDARKLSENGRLQQTVADNARHFRLMIRNLQGKAERQEALEHGFRYGEGFVA